MSLIKSISGIRGTIGGRAGDGLSPLDIVKFTSAYATFIRRTTALSSNKIVVGRDARLSGEMVLNVVVGTLEGMGFIIEKAFQKGREVIEKEGIRCESLAIIDSLDNCEIKLREE